MTDEELAVNWVTANTGFNPKEPLGKIAVRIFLAGLKAGRLEWHDLRKDQNDLPKNGDYILANNISTIECVVFKKEEDGNHWRHDMFELRNVIKWCEIPKYTEE